MNTSVTVPMDIIPSAVSMAVISLGILRVVLSLIMSRQYRSFNNRVSTVNSLFGGF